jgi:hypothetical protein
MSNDEEIEEESDNEESMNEEINDEFEQKLLDRPEWSSLDKVHDNAESREHRRAEAEAALKRLQEMEAQETSSKFIDNRRKYANPDDRRTKRNEYMRNYMRKYIAGKRDNVPSQQEVDPVELQTMKMEIEVLKQRLAEAQAQLLQRSTPHKQPPVVWQSRTGVEQSSPTKTQHFIPPIQSNRGPSFNYGGTLLDQFNSGYYRR